MGEPLQSCSTAILVTRNGMGRADTELSHKLINVYFDLLVANNMLPSHICFYGEGVKLTVEGSPVLDVLTSLEKKGVHLSICITCLDYYGVRQSVKVGHIENMLKILEYQWKADKVITI
ncbi:MAG: DsrE family protein [bacterium]